MAERLWENTVDQPVAYVVYVEHTADAYRGELVAETVDGTELLREPVGISFGGPFGPDVDDVADWRARGMAAIEAWEAK